MKFDVCSDLHVDINNEFFDFKELKNDGSRVLVIAGDIANDLATAFDIISNAASIYEHVVFVDGNHEHYSNRHQGLNVPYTMCQFEQFADKNDNVHYLDGERTFFLDGTLFVGANGWYDFEFAPEQYDRALVKNIWRKEMNDFRYCNFQLEPEKLAFNQAALMVKNVKIAQTNNDVKTIVVVTHTVSHIKGLTFTGEPVWDMLSGAYGNSLMRNVFESDVTQKIKYAVCGHTHFRKWFVDGNIEWYINPRGYDAHGEGINWSMIQIDTDQ